MILFLSLIAAIGCAVSNGIAAILEKIGSNNELKSGKLSLSTFWLISKNFTYLAGIALDLLAWLLTLFAVHNLPLFEVQPIIACSIIVTIIVEHFLFNHPLNYKFIGSLFVIIVGLGLLALASSPEKSSVIGETVRLGIFLAPVLLSIVGLLVIKIKNKYSTLTLAAMSGLAFGGVSISGRAINFTSPYIHILTNPLLWIILPYGILGIFFFTIALQRSTATSVSATMIAGETILPILIGIGFLGDHPRNSLWIPMVIGIVFTFAGTIYISLNSENI